LYCRDCREPVAVRWGAIFAEDSMLHSSSVASLAPCPRLAHRAPMWPWTAASSLLLSNLIKSLFKSFLRVLHLKWMLRCILPRRLRLIERDFVNLLRYAATLVTLVAFLACSLALNTVSSQTFPYRPALCQSSATLHAPRRCVCMCISVTSVCWRNLPVDEGQIRLVR